MSITILKTLTPQKGSCLGELICEWAQEQFKIIMENADFYCTQQGIFKKKLKLPNGKVVTINAYETGKMTIFGCNSQHEMKIVINAFFNQKLYQDSNTVLNFAENLRVTYSRCKLELGFDIDMIGLQRYIVKNIKNQGKNKAQMLKPRILIPVKLHRFKSLTIFVSKNGVIEIMKAHLVDNVNQVFKKIFNNFLCDFIIAKPQTKTPLVRKYNVYQNEEINFRNFEEI